MVSKTLVLGAGFSKHAWLGSGSLARPCLFDSCRHHSRPVYEVHTHLLPKFDEETEEPLARLGKRQWYHSEGHASLQDDGE